MSNVPESGSPRDEKSEEVPDRSGEEFEGTRSAMRRARQRLNVLEYLLLGGAAIFSVLGGALVAWFLSSTTTLSFRITWIVASLLFFLVPAVAVYLKELRPDDG